MCAYPPRRVHSLVTGNILALRSLDPPQSRRCPSRSPSESTTRQVQKPIVVNVLFLWKIMFFLGRFLIAVWFSSSERELSQHIFLVLYTYGINIFREMVIEEIFSVSKQVGQDGPHRFE